MQNSGETVLEPDFAGDIGETVGESLPWWPRRPQRTGPNVVVILLDDVGFAQFGCFGSSISTPNIDALAGDGLRYTNFHVPALCSPTRASLLTGRNHHAVGVGFLGAFDTGFPSYRGAISPSAATVAEVLRDNGYGTYAIGKWHLTPPQQMSPAGPFAQWPTQRGFDRYYGYLWGEDDQWQPELWYDQHRVETPADEDYHFSQDLVDHAQEFISDHLTNRSDDPFFAYLAFGACHAPHQAPAEYIDRYAGRFDHGWDDEREAVLARQIDLGVVPPGTELCERNPGVPQWDSLTTDERRLFARLQEAFAGFMEHTDEQIGRFIGFLRSRGVLEDTVILLMSDNGASGEGGRNGTINEYRYFLGLDDSLDDSLDAIGDIGGRATHNQYPAGWAQTGNTPLKHYKKHTHGGGVRSPLIVHWPGGIQDTGIRTQFHHVIDVTPTILDLTRSQMPDDYRGVRQLPLHGTSLTYSFAGAGEPSTRTTQYFETAGYRGIYRDGWKAVTAHRPGTPFIDDVWELYDLRHDFSEAHDLASAHPEKAAELESLWWSEAGRYGVLPLDDRMSERVKGLDPAADRRHYTLLPGSRMLNHVVGPSFSERPFLVSTTMDLTEADEGVILAFGRRAFGFSFFIRGGRLVAHFNLAGRRTELRSPSELEPGVRLLQMQVALEADEVVARLLIDGQMVASAPLPRLLPGGIGTLSLQCGHNAPSPVSPEYDPPFAFTGALRQVDIDLGRRARDSSDADWKAELAWQ